MQINNMSPINSKDFQVLKTSPSILPASGESFEALFLVSLLKNNCMKTHFVNESQEEYKPSPVIVYDATVEKIEEDRRELFPVQSVQNISQSSTDTFIQSIWPYATKAASMLNIEPRILLAQAILETGWGLRITKTREGSSNNIFNIKSTRTDTQDSLSVKTLEYVNNTPVLMQENFKKYASVEASFQDYVALLTNNARYQNALQQTDNPEKFIQAVHEAGYATDPQYSQKILSIYHSKELAAAMERCGIVALCLENNA